MLYALAAGGLILFGSQIYINRLRMRQTLALQQREMALNQQETEQLRVVDEMKSTFFANVTHEFRTPLTLILIPTEQLDHRRPKVPVRDPPQRQSTAGVSQSVTRPLEAGSRGITRGGSTRRPEAIH